LAQGLLEHLILGAEVFNDLLLLTIDLVGQDHERQLPGLQNEIHGEASNLVRVAQRG
jgi:hypothetical protein